MHAQIALVTLLTDDVPRLVAFYRDALGMRTKTEMGAYVEFEHPGVRFAICDRSELVRATAAPSYSEGRRGQVVELAFPVARPEDVDAAYADVVARGATPITAPANMPWGQRAAFFADPDGNIHELFADLQPQGQ